MESRKSEDIEGIEKEIESELSRISVSSFEADEPDTEVSEESASDTESISDELPESVLSYLNFIKNRNQDAEKVILQDLEDEETTSNIHEVVPCYASDHVAELASEYNEDPEQFKKRVLFEVENEDLQVATISNYNNQATSEVVTDDLFLTADVEMNVSLTYREVEEKCRQEFEQWEKRQSEIEDEKRKKWKTEREAWEKQTEEEHARRMQHLEKFEAERMELDLLHKKQQTVMEDELQKEKKAWRDKMTQHEEVIMKLQLQMEQEKRAFEEQKAKESKHRAEQRDTAAVKIQARFRAYLVHKEYAPILKQWKDEIKKKKKIQEEIEREMKVREEKMRRRMEERKQNKEEEKKRQEELERQKYLEQVGRRKEYEKKKASLRLVREKQLQIREEQRKLREKIAKAVITENRENNKENIKGNKLTENTDVIRDKKKELNKQGEEQKEEQTKMMGETNSGMISTEGKLAPTLNVLISEKEESSQVNNENIHINLVKYIEENYSQTEELNKASGIHALKDESVDFGANQMVENKSNDTCSSQSNVQSNTTFTGDQDQFSQSETIKKTVLLVEDANEEVIKNWDTVQEVSECSNRLILPNDIEKKRANWMSTCKSWSQIYEENQRKVPNIKKRSRKTSVSKMPPLSIQKIIHSGPWSTLQQITTLTLEDLPACSLSTLSECSNLQVLTLRRCGLVALEGLSSCKDLKYINVEENNIQIINCENLENLCILILNKNNLSSVCGLDGCINLQNLELSYNRITRIGGLESLKNLQQLIVDHNQLISTKGLCEVPTLIHLDCSFNHLTQVEGIESCGLLQILKLQGNNLQELPRLENHVLLRELYLDDNSISAVRMLSLYWLPLLQILLLSQNSLTELVPLNSFVSLEKLDIKNNCLSDLKSVITCLSGCSNLREFSLSGNPLLQERNWRPSLCKVLPRLQLLDGENLHCHTLPTTERIKISKSRTFLELCQVQIEENVLLKKKVVEVGIASSIDAVQRQCWYFNQLMKLSIEHRCAHEYGELSTTDRDRPETLQNHLKQTSTSCLQESNLFIMGVTENKQVLLDPSERWITTGQFQATFINSSISVHQKENKEDHRMEQKSTESCINYNGESNGNKNISAHLTLQQSVIESNMGRGRQYFENNTERLHMAAYVIQSHWRKYLIRRKTDCTKTRNDHFREALRQKHEAATVIQASWKGFRLRRKLSSALAAVKSDEVDDNYEEINVNDFVSHEAALENEWLTLDSTHFPSKTPLISNQLHWTKYARPSNSSEHSNNLQLSPQAPWQCVDRPHSCSRENTHYHRSSEKGTMSQNSDLKEKKKFSFRSEKEEKISEEWGFKDISTAQLMLKRAQKMKPRKYSNKNVDPAVRLALFKNNENKHLHVKPPKIRSVNAGYFEGEKEEFSQLDTTLDEKLQRRKDFTYQWLHTQHSDYETASSKNMKGCCFLPELDHVICNSRQVQLVASPVSREDTELDLVSLASGSALTVNREKNKQPHRHSARSSKKNISTPEKSHLGPSCRERISFRDHPLQFSGGWGTGKKRQKVKNIS